MKLKIIAGSIVLACTVAPAFAGNHSLLPAQAGDMIPSVLMARTRTSGTTITTPATHARLERQPVSISWPLPHGAHLQPIPQPFARSSREYWTDVSASELQQGIQLPLSAPGAIIRLSPSDRIGGRLHPSNMRLQLGRKSIPLDQATSQIANTQALRAAGMAVSDASIVIQLKPSLGSGMATLRAPAASGRYVVHVFEPKSTLSAIALADRDDVLLGHRVHLRVALHDGGRMIPLIAAGGFLRAPDGSTTLLNYQHQADGSFAVDATPKTISTTPGLWEVHSFTVGDDAAGNEVRRDTTTVFAAAAPDARLGEVVETRRATDHGIDIVFGVTTADSSRYAVSAVLYGRDVGTGTMVPAAYAQSAAWLSSGKGQLVLHYDRASLDGVGAPYELHDLRLQNQPAISLVERRALAMRFDTP